MRKSWAMLRGVVCAGAVVAAASAATADPASVVRIESGRTIVSGVPLGEGLVVASPGAIEDGAEAIVYRAGAASAPQTVRVQGGLLIVGGVDAPIARLAAGPPIEGEARVSVAAAARSVQTSVTAILSAPAGGSARIVQGPEGGGIAFNGCGEVAALVAPDGGVMQASAIAAALSDAGRPVARAQAPCTTAVAEESAAQIDALNDQISDLEAQLSRARTAQQRRRIQDQIDQLRDQLNAETQAQAARAAAAEKQKQEALAVAAKQKAENDRQRRLAIIIGAVAAGVLILVIAFAIWFWMRSRRLKKSLAEAQKKKDAPNWNDCVLENDSGLTVKLPGAKLAQGGVVLGRSREESDVVVDKDDVSRRHAKFEVIDGALHVSDLGSTNKTKVNGTELERALVKRIYEGDKVSIGSNEFTVRILRGRS